MRRINLLAGRADPLQYERYLKFQARLRERRRECVLFCGHPPTLTAGVQARAENLRASPAALGLAGVHLVNVGRGGDYTAHEPGQCVIYPHVDLRARHWGVSDFFQALLQTTARVLHAVWKIEVESREAAPGLYLRDGGAKIASIGVMFKSFFTSHGIAINISNEGSTFGLIHPCGFPDQRIISIAQLGGEPAELPRFIEAWYDEFSTTLPVAH